MRYILDRERRLVISTASDRLTFAEVMAYRTRLQSDPDFRPEFNELLDGRTVTHLDVTIDEAKEIARRPVFSETSLRAWVASGPAVFGMGRLIATYNEYSETPSQISVFYDLPSALQWLGLEVLPAPIGLKAEDDETAKDDKIP